MMSASIVICLLVSHVGVTFRMTLAPRHLHAEEGSHCHGDQEHDSEEDDGKEEGQGLMAAGVIYGGRCHDSAS